MAFHSLNYISLCAGGGGLDLGFDFACERARAVCYVEREAFAAAHLVAAIKQGLMAPAPLWSDVTTFNGRPWRGVVDFVIGGIPCQPHSAAGKRLGEDDERDLWSDARRIIVQSGAWGVLIENVEGMLSSGGARRVRRDLQRLGFIVEGGLFSAEEVGATHQRNRLFILAVADRFGAGLEGFRRHGAGGDESGRIAALEDGSARQSGVSVGDAARNAWAVYAGSRRSERTQTDPRGPSKALANPGAGGCDGRPDIKERGSQGRGLREWTSVGMQPPGPQDIDRWRAVLERAPGLEPAFRRVADGVAAGLDVDRIDRLRMLGNGVHPLQAAYAIRALWARLAARIGPIAGKPL